VGLAELLALSPLSRVPRIHLNGPTSFIYASNSSIFTKKKIKKKLSSPHEK